MTVRYESEAATGLRTAGHDGVLVATLDRPPANALNRPLLLAMIALFRDRGEGDPPPVVITGAGDRFFCAGGDIKEVDGAAAGPIQQRMRGFHNLLVAMERYRAPVIAAVNGDCVGGGVEYALFADAVLAAPHARFGFPEIRHGLLPADKGIQRLIRLIGMRRARDLLLSGELIGAEEAARWGLVDAIIEPGRLMIEALDRAREAGRRAPVLYAALKHALCGAQACRQRLRRHRGPTASRRHARQGCLLDRRPRGPEPPRRMEEAAGAVAVFRRNAAGTEHHTRPHVGQPGLPLGNGAI